MGKALYRKYRSKKLSEIVGQEHVTETLDRALKQGNLSHAYLFTGPRGVGKTSIARILAHEANGLPYDEEKNHLDIIEIDAASNRRIDEIRELKEKVHIAPTSSKYKVYIIDEVHMLTKEAFNALLKTLEEPPAHALFILATTEAHKVPETIVSRTQRFSFKPVEQTKAIAHIKSIAKNEHIQIEDNALELIAALGEGSLRDSISLLDQVRHVSDKITKSDVEQAIGRAPETLLHAVLKALAGSLSETEATLRSLRDHGTQATQISQQLSQTLRQQLLDNQLTISHDEALKLLNALLQVPSASDPALALELALYQTALAQNVPATHQKLPQTVEKPVIEQETAIIAEIPLDEKPETREQKIEGKSHTIEKPKPAYSQPLVKKDLDDTGWPDILAAIRAKHSTLYGIVRMASPQFEPGKITLSFAFAFHHKRLSETKNKKMLEEIIKEVMNTPVALELVLEDGKPTLKTEPSTEKPQEDEQIKTISNIFGSVEVLE